MNTTTEIKEQRAINLLKSFSAAAGEPIEISYSGGKDSDIILKLAELAEVEYRAIHKSTTIDRPGTLAHCREVGAEIIRPKKSFLQLIEAKGFPSRMSRFCCEVLKEYKVLPFAVQGIRRAESTARGMRYHEGDYIICRFYRTKKSRTQVALPILDWTEADELDFIEKHNLKLHPHYYDERGQLDLTRRLGCIGCPLKADNGLADLIEYPKMARQMIKAAKVWWNKPREKPMRSQMHFRDVYELLYFHLFSKNLTEFLGHHYYPDFCRIKLEELFGDLP